jgi:hypothetical protein
MAIDTHLIRNTKTNAKVLTMGYFVALLILGGMNSCRFMLALLGRSSSCAAILEAEAKLANLTGNDLANVFCLMCGSVGFALSASGTRSWKWLGIGGLLFAIFLLVLAVTVLSAQT